MAKEVWFTDSSGKEISCNEGSVAHGLMTNDGTFTQIDGPGGAAVPAAAEAEAPPAKAPAKKAAKK